MKKLILAIAIFLGASPLWAEIMTYQGRLKEADIPVSANRVLNFEFCDAPTGGNCYATASGPQSFFVQNGLFKSTFAVPTADLSQGEWHLQVAVGPDVPGLQILAPRERLTAVPYAVFASSAGHAAYAVNAAYAAGTLLKAGDTMTGQLTVSGSTVTVIGPDGNANGGLMWVSTSAATPALFVSTTGRVGVGTAAPGYPVHIVNNSGQVALRVEGMNATATSIYVESKSGGKPAHGYVSGGTLKAMTSVDSSNNFQIEVGPDPRLTITPAGLVGISTTAPAYQLHVSSAAGEAGTIMAVSTGTSNLFWVAGDGAHAVRFVGDGSGLTGVTGATGTDPNALQLSGGTLTGPLSVTANMAISPFDIQTNGINISTAGAITTAGLGLGSATANPRGRGAVDLQTHRVNGNESATGDYSVLSGGKANKSAGNYSFTGGGQNNSAYGTASTLLGGDNNAVTGNYSFVGGGANNSLPAYASVIAGGQNNQISALSNYSAVLGGLFNQADANFAAVGGGQYNLVLGSNSVIAGGVYNVVTGTSASVAGGEGNKASEYFAAVGGGNFNEAKGEISYVGGGRGNTASAPKAVVGGGLNNEAGGIGAVVAGGDGNQALAQSGTISGGDNNLIPASAITSVIGGGSYNEATGSIATIGGGYGNKAGQLGTVAGGQMNAALGQYSVAPGGYNNTAEGNYSFAAGAKSSSTAQGAFTWQDSGGATINLVNAVTDRTVFKSRGGFLVTGSTNTSMTGSLDRGVIITGNGLLGVATSVPQAALDVVSSGTAAGVYAQIWRDATGTVVASMTAAGSFTSLQPLAGDDLGDHNADQDLQLNWHNIYTVSTVTAAGHVTAAAYQVNGSTVLALGSVAPRSLFVGADAGRNNTASTFNTLVGNGAGWGGSGAAFNRVTAVGAEAGLSLVSGSYNSLVGVSAGYLMSSGEFNTVMGTLAGYSDTSGSHNVIVGHRAGYFTSTGSSNTLVGDYAGFGAGGNSFSDNSVLGANAGYSLTTGSRNILIGVDAGRNIAGGSDNLVIGNNQGPSSPGAASELNIGGVIFGTLNQRAVGISTRAPQAALDVVSTGTGAGYFAQIWRNSSGVTVSSVSSLGVFYGNGAGLTNVTAAGAVQKTGDTMQGALNMNGFVLTGVSTITMLNGSIAIVPPGTGGNNYTYGISIGSNSYDNHSYGVGLGVDTLSNFTYGVGVGFHANNNYNNGVGVGNTAEYNFNSGVGVGISASSNNDFGVGVGKGASGNSNYGVGIGANAANNKAYAAAVGAYSFAATSSTALGSYSKANARDSVAIGAWTVNNSTGTASFGNYAVHTATAVNAAYYQVNGSTVLALLSGLGSLAVGPEAGKYSIGAYNLFIGSAAGNASAAGTNNTMLGYKAGYANDGSGNTFIGGAAGSLNATGNQNIVIGNNQQTSAFGASSELNIGGLIFGKFGDRSVGISTRVPQAALDVVSTGTAAGFYAQIWRDSSGVAVSSVNSLGVFFGNGSGLTNLPVPAGAVQKAGDFMTGQLTTSSTITVQGNSFSVGTSTFVVNAGRVGVNWITPEAALQVSGGAKFLSSSGTSYILTAGSPARPDMFFVSSGGAVGMGDFTGVSVDTASAVQISSRLTAATNGTEDVRVGLFVESNTDGTLDAADLMVSAILEATVRGADSPSLVSPLRLKVRRENAPTGTVDRAIGLFIDDLQNEAGGTINSTYGIFIGDQSSGAQNNAPYALFSADPNALSYFAGSVGIARTAPEARLDLTAAGLGPEFMGQIWRNYDGTIVSSVSATGVLMAGKFIGDGGGLYNISATDPSKISRNGDTMTGQLTMSGSSITIRNSAGYEGLEIRDPSGLVMPELRLARDAGTYWDIGGASGGTPLVFQYVGITRMFLTSDGHLTLNDSGQVVSRLHLRPTAMDSYSLYISSADGTPALTVSPGGQLYTAGRVGIGSLTPAEALDISGRVLISTNAGNSSTDGLLSNGSNGMIFQSAGTKYMQVAYGGGYVGVGPNANVYTDTMSPRLQVKGSMSVGANYNAKHPAQDSLIVEGSLGVSTDTPTGLFQVGGGTLTVLASGNVGVGTRNPFSRLSVIEESVAGSQYILHAATSSSSYQFMVTTAGWVGINTHTPQAPLHLTAATKDEGIVVEHNSGTSEGSYLALLKARGTAASQSLVANGDNLGVLAFGGYNATTGDPFPTAAAIVGRVDGTPTLSAPDMPGRLEFMTAADGTNETVARMVIRNDGGVGIATGTPQAMLDIRSTATIAQIWRDAGGVVVASVTSLGRFYGDGSGLTGLSAVSRSGDTMTGPLLIDGAVAGDAFRIGASTFVVTGGRVGIQKIPGASNSLDIGPLPALSDTQMEMYNSGGKYVQFRVRSDPSFDILTGAADTPIRLSPGASTVAVFKPGAVGIGTMFPASLLHVDGGSVTISGSLADLAYALKAGDNGLVISTGGAVQTTGIGHGAVAGGVRGRGAVDLQTARLTSGQVALGDFSTLSGGAYNTILGSNTVVAGGRFNVAAGTASVISGGENNFADARYSVVGGGRGNSANADYSAVFSGQANIVDGQAAFVGGGVSNTVEFNYGAIAGGMNNTVGPVADYGFVGGGYQNTAGASHSAVAGGWNNTANGLDAFIGAGYMNVANGEKSVVGGGTFNTTDAQYGVIAGGYENKMPSGSIAAFIGGGKNNTIDPSMEYSAIVGGSSNTVSGMRSFIGGGGPVNLGDPGNKVFSDNSVIVGGGRNLATADSWLSFIGGGSDNRVRAQLSVVVGGNSNIAGTAPASMYAGVVSGWENMALGDSSFVGGGGMNTASGSYATVPGGYQNTAKGTYSFAAGYKSSSTAAGTFTWADSAGAEVLNAVANQVMFKAAGGFWVSTGTVYTDPGLYVSAVNKVGIGTSAPGFRLHVKDTFGGAIAGLTNSVSATDAAVYGWSNNGATAVKGVAASGYAGRFEGNVFVTGDGVNPANPAKLQVNGDLGLGNGLQDGNTPIVIWLTASTSFADGDVVVVSGNYLFGTTVAVSTTTVMGVAMGSGGAAATGKIAVAGVVTVNCVNGFAGNHAVTSATAGMVQGQAAPTTATSVGLFLTNCGNPVANKARLLLK